MSNDSRLNRIFAFLVFVVSTSIYLKTVAPTTPFWDCGEFITCAYILGIPHPPGAPFYVLLGRIFSMLPLAKDIAMRVNITSSLMSGITVMLTYLIIVRLITMFRGRPRDVYDQIILYGSGIIGALAFAFTDTFWFNAEEAEVYAISMFFTSFVVWLILVWREKADAPSSDRYILLIAYCVGLAIGVHLLNILALPTIFLIFYFRKHKLEFSSFIVFIFVSLLIFWAIYPGIVKWLPNMSLAIKNATSPQFTAILVIILGSLLFYSLYKAIKNKNRIAALALMSFLLIIVGASTYTGVYIRSNLNPPIDENDPENMENMVNYLNRTQYGDWSIIERRAPLWEYQIKKMYIRYFGWQFIGKGTTLDANLRIAETISFNGLLGLPFLVGIIGMFHHFEKDWKHALSIMLLFIMTGIAIVIYLNQDDPQPRERDYVYVASFFAFALWIGIGVSAIAGRLKDLIYKFKPGQKIIALATCFIILFVALPVNLFSFNYHSHDRTGNYVAYDYSYNILQSCEKDAILFTNGDNDTFPLWFLQYVENIRPDVRVVNLSLLNTPWYIMQLKHQQPKVPISLTDAQIKNIGGLIPWAEKKTIEIPVPDSAYEREMQDMKSRGEWDKERSRPGFISIVVAPTVVGRAIRVQDYMVLNIIYTNKWRKPIYFALTVSDDNKVGLHRYLRMDGMAFKLCPYPDLQISPTRLHKNLFQVFLFRNLNNPQVYLDNKTKGLLINYRSEFLRLANYYLQRGEREKMLQVLDRMEQLIPESLIPIGDSRIVLSIGRMYEAAGRSQEYERRLRAVIERDPNMMQAYALLLEFLRQHHRYQDAVELMKQWLRLNPGDRNAQNILAELQKQLAATQKSTTGSQPNTKKNIK